MCSVSEYYLFIFVKNKQILKKFLFLFFALQTIIAFSQKKQLKILNADYTITDEDKYPNAKALLGNILVEIDGATIQCDKALLFPDKNFIEVFGNVILKQGDTITQTSKYGDYDGNKKIARAWGDVVLNNQTMELQTEKLHFDRTKQELYYNTFGTIKDETNTLTSNKGRYFLKTSKFQAITNVKIVNPDNTLTGKHLDYYTNTGIVKVSGPTIIKGKDNTIFTDKGWHNTKTKLSKLTKNSKIIYKDRWIESDTIFQDDTKKFAYASGHVKITDTINKAVSRSGYAEYFQEKDSIMLTKKAVVVTLVDKDSMYIHGSKLLLTGKAKKRIIRAFYKVQFFKSDLRGKCDSLFNSQETGITQMFVSPVLWTQEQQITGNLIEMLSNKTTEKLDSLKVLGNAFIIKKDSSGYNQTKGKNIYALFNDNKIDTLNVYGNSEVITFNRDEKEKLMGITRMKSSTIQVVLKNQQVQTIDFKGDPDGKTYPLSKFPENKYKLKGFIWRENEKPQTPLDIFIWKPIPLVTKTTEKPQETKQQNRKSQKDLKANTALNKKKKSKNKPVFRPSIKK